MKQTLQLRIGQNLTMTPQLQQAIRLLQLSTIELQQEVQRALEENPLLEQEEQSEPIESTEENADTHITTDDDQNHWESYIRGDAATAPISSNQQADHVYQGETSETLHDYLFWQMRLTPFSPTDQMIATAIIDAIDDSGYLQSTLEDIQTSVVQADSQGIGIDEIEAVLKRVQHFDPIGVGARGTQECLLIQLAQFDPNTTPYHTLAQCLLEEHIELLATRDFRVLKRQMKLKDQDLSGALALIQSLEPRPGNQLFHAPETFLIPDVLVEKVNHHWRVRLNPEATPKLHVNQNYIDLIQQSSSHDGEQFIRTHAQEARWFIKSLESRNETLLKVAQCIVQHQQNFLENGEEAMIPLVLNDVAQAIEMHESTISRVTTQKYMHTPRGTFELKYFFSSHVQTKAGQGCSSTAIRALVKKLVACENPQKPLSDSKITHLLAEQGIIVARRTIAKYREALLIPPSSQRKQI